MPYLEVRTQEGPETITLETAPVTIGRHPSNLMRLEDKLLSRRHCVVERLGDTWRIRDLGSRNGIRVNGQRCAVADLAPGDEIRLGNIKIRFLDAELHSLGDGWPGIAERFGASRGLEIDLGQIVSEARPDFASRIRGLCEVAPRRTPSFGGLEFRPLNGPIADTDEDATLVRLITLAALRFGAVGYLISCDESSAEVRLRLDGRTIPVANIDADTGMRLIRCLARWAGTPGTGGSGSVTCDIDGEPIVCGIELKRTGAMWTMVFDLPPTDSGWERYSDLGMPPLVQSRTHASITRQSGLVVVASPPRGGVGTTLSVLRRECERATPWRRIVVASGQGASQADEMRELLAGDPDVLVLGRLTDPVAARLACEAAMSRHLVMVGVTAKDSVSALLRMLELGVSSTLLGDAVHTILAQRLIRLLCIRCRHTVAATTSQALAMGKSLEGVPGINSAQGCPGCLETGFIGRRALFELLEMNNTIRDILLTGPTIGAIRDTLTGSGHRSLRKAGLELVAMGETSFDEIDRVLPEDGS